MWWPCCKEGEADHRLAPEGTWQMLFFKRWGLSPFLNICLANTRDRLVVILGLVEKQALESEFSFGLTTPQKAMWQMCWSSLIKHAVGTMWLLDQCYFHVEELSFMARQVFFPLWILCIHTSVLIVFCMGTEIKHRRAGGRYLKVQPLCWDPMGISLPLPLTFPSVPFASNWKFHIPN